MLSRKVEIRQEEADRKLRDVKVNLSEVMELIGKEYGLDVRVEFVELSEVPESRSQAIDSNIVIKFAQDFDGDMSIQEVIKLRLCTYIDSVLNYLQAAGGFVIYFTSDVTGVVLYSRPTDEGFKAIQLLSSLETRIIHCGYTRYRYRNPKNYKKILRTVSGIDVSKVDSSCTADDIVGMVVAKVKKLYTGGEQKDWITIGGPIVRLDPETSRIGVEINLYQKQQYIDFVVGEPQ